METNNDSNDAFVTTHTSAQYLYGESGSAYNGEQKVNEEETKCRNTTKVLAFSAFLIALSVGGYFAADLLANKGNSVKLKEAGNDADILPLETEEAVLHTDVTQDIRADVYSSYGSYNPSWSYSYSSGSSGYQYQPESFPNGQQPAADKGGSMLRVTNCDQKMDYSDDKESYQADIRAVADYLKTYWASYSTAIAADVEQDFLGQILDASCLQTKFESGEVVCADVKCVYDGECAWKTEWDSIGICKYYYFDIGNLKHQQRADRRACIAAMLVEQWTGSCYGDSLSVELQQATFKWWKQIFTVSDDWELDDCPC